MNFLKLFTSAKGLVDRVLTTSSKTKLLVMVGLIMYVDSATLAPVDKVKFISALGVSFLLAQGFAEGLSRKYAPK